MDKDICGVAEWNIASNSGLTLTDSQSNSVTLRYPASSHRLTDPIWLSIAPVAEVTTMAFTIKTVGDKYYQAVATGLKKTFAEGTQTKFDLPINAKWKEGTFQKCYKRISDISDVTAGKYMIVATTTSLGTLYLPNVVCTTGSPQGAAAPDKDTIWMNHDEEWEIVPGVGGVEIKNGDNYLYNSGSGLRVGPTSATWVVSTHPQYNDFFKIEKDGTYCCGVASGDWRACGFSSPLYSTDEGTNKIKLYKRVN